MKLIRVGAAVLNQTPLDWDGNADRIKGAIQAAREAGVSILCLPELCITGYGCEDALVADRPGADLASRGVDLILNPSASHFAFGKHEIRKRFVTEGSRAFNVGYIYANLLGNESGRAIYDGDAMIAQAGKLLATGPRFSYADWHVTHAVVDIDLIRMSRARTASYRPPIAPEGNETVAATFDFPSIKPKREVATHPAWETS